MSVEFYRESPGKFDSKTLSRETLSRWTGRTPAHMLTRLRPISSNLTVILVAISSGVPISYNVSREIGRILIHLYYLLYT